MFNFYTIKATASSKKILPTLVGFIKITTFVVISVCGTSV